MVIQKLKDSQQLEEAVRVLFPEQVQDHNFKSFDIIPYDEEIEDLISAKLYYSTDKLVIAHDKVIKIFKFDEIEIIYMGDKPRFSIIQQLLEDKYQNAIEDIRKMQENNDLPRFEIKEKNSNNLPMRIVLRKSYETASPFRTWAASQLLFDISMKKPVDIFLEEMASANFTNFNKRSLMSFLGIFAGYILLSMICSINIVPPIIGTILNILFGGVMIAMVGWLYYEIEKNNKKYKSIYSRYQF